MKTLDSIVSDFRSTYEAVEQETAMREQLISSQAYQSIQAEIDALQAKQNELLAAIPDSREEHAMDEKELIAYMQENKITEAGEFKAKTRAKRSVDTYAVLQAMHGDIDALMLVSSVKQKDLEDFIKANPTYRKDLRSCIRDEGFTITSIVKA